MDTRDELIKKYFARGYTQKEIIALLDAQHGITLGRTCLKGILADLKLYRRKEYSNLVLVSRFISEQIANTGYNKGYRWMYLECITKGKFVVRKEDVRKLLKILTPENVADRLRRKLKRRSYYNKGPNYLWHMDGYDKLKPYGLCISGCIDGFSRKIMWLNAYHTNNNPLVIAGYFCEAISAVGGCPTMLRADLGTENGTVATIQRTLRSAGHDRNVDHCFLYGKSTANQRIEAWWGILRKESAQCWMNELVKLKNEGFFSGSHLDKNLIQFCFTRILQNDLDQIATIWNYHTITKKRITTFPNGKPDLLFTVPEKYGGEQRLKPVPLEAYRNVLNMCVFREECICSNRNVYDLSLIYMRENGWSLPTNIHEARILYVNLRVRFVMDLNLP